MCGTVGHMDTRCPTKCCLGCGTPGGMFLESCLHCRNLARVECQECGGLGHLRMFCPDLWRRYHLTTRPGPPVEPMMDSHKKKYERWCCNCGREGHLVDQCKRYLYSKYPAPELTVKNYSEPPQFHLDEPKAPEGEKRQKYVSSSPGWQFIRTDPQASDDTKKARKEEKREMRKAEKKRQKQLKFGLNRSEPGSAVASQAATPKYFRSEPASPKMVPLQVPATNSLLEKAVEKLSGKEKFKLKRQEQRDRKKIFKLAKLVGNKNCKKLLGDCEVDVDTVPGYLQQGRKQQEPAEKVNVRARDFLKFQDRRNNREMEFKNKRGFGKEKDFPRSKKSPAMDLIPGNVKAAIRVLNKEVNVERNFPGAKKLKKSIRSEIWCLRNSLSLTDQLKNVERIRIGGLVLQLKNGS